MAIRRIAIEISDLPLTVARLLQTDVFAKNTGLWIKGGIAREALIRHCATLSGRVFPMMEPRDVDLIVTGRSLSEDDVAELESSIGGKFDSAEASSLESHLESADFTLNEVALRPGVLVCTDEAFNAAVTGRIELTRFELEVWEEEMYEENPHLLLKLAVRASVFASRYGFEILRLADFGDGGWPNGQFWRVLQGARKAHQYGVLQEYTDLLVQFHGVRDLLKGAVEGYALEEITPALVKALVVATGDDFWVSHYEQALEFQSQFQE